MVLQDSIGNVEDIGHCPYPFEHALDTHAKDKWQREEKTYMLEQIWL